jgi:hypothetical protein
MNGRLWHFVGGSAGQFQVTSVTAISGETLPAAPRLFVGQEAPPPSSEAFRLLGVVSNERYATRSEKGELVARQEAMGRAEAREGAMIAIKKNDQWWAMPQDERRAIFEERSRHVQIGMDALPQVARRLHHCRDLESDAPFDFLTWFDFKASDRNIFDDLVACLRDTEEWKYVDREVDVRVVRDGG